jgi:flagellin-like protein
MSNENLNIGFFNIKYSSVRLKSFRDNRKAISPVISTIIIVAVAIAISIAVAFWLGGITSIFTRFEKLEITTAYAVAINKPFSGWNITLEVKNTGTTAVTITDVLINGIPSSAYTEVLQNGTNVYLNTGESKVIMITIPTQADSYTFTAGQAVTVTIHTAGGQDYPKTVTLP